MRTHASSNPTKFGFYAIGFGIFLLIHGLRNFLRTRKITDASTIPIASAPQGLVEFQGYAYPVMQVMKTIAGRSCVVLEYELQVENKNSWSTVWTSANYNRFGIVDSSGIACVDASNAVTEIKQQIYYWKKLDERAQNELALLVGGEVKGFPPASSFFSFRKTYRLIEKAIYIGTPIYVMGSFRTPSEPQAIYLGLNFPKFFKKVQDLMKTRKFETAALGALTDKHKSLMLRKQLSKANKVANFDLDLQEKNLDENNSSITPGDIPILGYVESSSSHQLFFADCHEKELLKRIGRWNVPLMILGIALIVVGIFIIVNNKHFSVSS